VTVYLNVEERVHPAFAPQQKDEEIAGKKFSVSAATGRLSAKGGIFYGKPTPPLYSLPKPLRSIILPDEGQLFVAADWDSQELRIIAARSGDSGLRRAIESGDDIHAATATLLGCDRTRAKNAFYGWAYGSKGKGLVSAFKQKGYHIHEKPFTEKCVECERFGKLPSAWEFVEALNQIYPGVPAWHKELVRFVEEHGYIADGFGHRRYFSDVRQSFNEIVNTTVQSSGSGMLWTTIKPIRQLAALHGGRMAFLLHDETLSSIPTDKVASYVPGLVAIMEQEFPQIAPGFRCPVQVKVGASWNMTKKDIYTASEVAA